MEALPEERLVPVATKWGACLPSGFLEGQDKANRCAPRSADCSSAAAEWRRRLEEARTARLGSLVAKPISRSVGCAPIQCVPLGKMVLPKSYSTDATAGESDVSTTGKEESSGDSSDQRNPLREQDLKQQAASLKREITRLTGMNAVLRRTASALDREDSYDDGIHVGHIHVAGFQKQVSGSIVEDEPEGFDNSGQSDLFSSPRVNFDLTRLTSDMDGEDNVEEIIEQHIDEEVDDHKAAVMSRRLTSFKKKEDESSIACRYIKNILFVIVASVLPIAILVTKSTGWDQEMAMHRREPPNSMVRHIAYATAGAGFLALMVTLFQQPLILGYLLGGVLVGDRCGLGVVPDIDEISEFSSLGLVFLLFMIGLELDVQELLKMGKVVLLTGLFQFPVCCLSHYGIFKVLSIIGLSFGEGAYSTLYVSMASSISSTMIVVKILAEMADMDSMPGRLTVGILIFQDIWAIVVLAIQPDLENPEPLVILKTFGMIAVLLAVALLYAKFVMPVVFVKSSRAADLLLVLGWSWCFLLGCFAILPFIGLSLELASLISGVALATFPYTPEFTGKIKYIRDFFITLFFVGLGMQIPVPSVDAIFKALLIAIIVLLVRWLGIFCVVFLLGGGTRMAAVSTVNLSQVSEFALVICSLGMNYKHVEEDTLTILIWTFAFLAILSSYMVGNNYRIYGILFSRCIRRRGMQRQQTLRASSGSTGSEEDEDSDDHPDRTIVILGFHKVAAMLLAHMEKHSPHILLHMHVVDRNEWIFPQIRNKGVTCSYGDISSPDVLEHAFHGEPRLVICCIADNMLQSVTKVKGCTNLRVLNVAKQVWPAADIIVTADHPAQARDLYDARADYVLRMSKLCAERLSDLTAEHAAHAHHHAGRGAFRGHRKKDEAEMFNPRQLIRFSHNNLDELAK